MSEHHAKISWERDGAPFDYQSYSRDHAWSFTGGVEVPASAAPDYLGSDNRVDPEEGFVAAVSSCHMLTFLAIAAKKKFVVDEYIDDAIGHLEKDGDGNLAITRITLRPRIVFAPDAGPTRDELDRLHHSAHKHCFIANSVKTAIDVEF